MNKKTENKNKITVTKPLKLDCGKTIKDFPLAFETYGKLNKNKDNAILVFHALTGDQFVAGTNPVTKKRVGGFQLLDQVKQSIRISIL